MKIRRRQQKPKVQPVRGRRPASADPRDSLSTFGGSLLTLESRITFDGAAVATVSTVTTEQIAQNQAEASFSADDATTSDSAPTAPTGEPPPSADQGLFDALATYDTSAARQEIAFLSASVLDYQQLLDGISPNVEVFVLDPARDGVEQMAEILAGRTGIDAIHLIGDGTEAEMHLSASFLTQESISTRYAEQFQQIGQSMSANADLLIYGCNFGQGVDGQLAMNTLADLTGADVAASTNRTGSADQYADWQLEVTTGSIETSVVTRESTQADWNHALVTFTVTTINDVVNGADGVTSLREAIIAANAAAGTDTINFSIVGAGVKTINLLSALPTITDAVTIDGYTQAGSSVNTLAIGNNAVLQIELDGTGAGSANGFWLGAGSDGSTISGLAINRFSLDGITINSTSNLIVGNFIGTNVAGTSALGNGLDGIEIFSSNNTIGGDTAAQRNIISGQLDDGINIDTGASGTIIQGNYIGTDKTGTLALGNQSDGVLMEGSASNTTIGGATAGAGNIIAFNAGIGVNVITGNGNAILGNSIYSNTGLGIDLNNDGVTANDAGDGDAGQNNLQNFPVIYGVFMTGGNATITGEARPGAIVEFFESPDVVGVNGEGQTFIGRGTVSGATPGTVDPSARQFSFTFAVGTLVIGDRVTATATDPTSNTSEFGLNVAAVLNAAPVLDTTKSPVLTAINEDAGAPAGAVGTLVSSLVDFASPVGQVDNVTDPNAGALPGIAVTAANTTNGTWLYSTNNGTSWNALGAVANNNALLLAADANTRLYFQPNANYNGTQANAITFRAWDNTSGSNGTKVSTTTNGGTTAFSALTDTASLTVTAVNDTPVVDLNAGAAGNNVTTAFTEQTPVLIAPVGRLTDVDSANLTSLLVTLTARPDGNAVESLALNAAATAAASGAGLTVSYTVGTGVLSITGSTTTAVYQSILRGILYNDTSNQPTTSNRTINVVANDGATASATQTVTLTVTAVNDAPVVDLNAGAAGNNVTTAFTEQTPVLIAPIGTLGDVDSANLNRLRVTLTARPDGNAVESLALNAAATAAASGAGLTVSYTPASGLLQITGAATTAVYQSILQGILYNNTSDMPTTSNRSITVVARDSTNVSSTSRTATMTVTAVNDAPVSTVPGAQVVNEDTALAIGGVSVTDVDGNLSTVQLGVTNGTVTVSLAGGATISSGANGTGTLTLAGTQAQINAALGTLSYQGNLNFNGSDTLTVTSTDSNAVTDVDTMALTVNPVNDAPLNSVPGAQNTNEDATLVFSVGNGNLISISDVDVGGAGLQVTLTGTNGLITLNGTAGLVFTVGDGTSDAMMTFTGTVASINTALAGMGFSPTPNFTGAASLQLVTNDQGNTGSGGPFSDTDTVNITVNAVNDAPIVVNQGLFFDGTDDVVVVNPSASLQVTTTVTMEAWVQRQGTATGTQILVNKEGEYEFGITSTGVIQWAFANATPGWNWVSAGYTLPANQWTHIAISYDSGVVNTYVNGALVHSYNGSGPIGDQYPALNELTFGGRQNTSTQRFEGLIDEVRVWNVARTGAQISANYDQTLTGGESGLVGYWQFAEATGTTAFDLTVNANNGVLGDGVPSNEPTRQFTYSMLEDGSLSVSVASGVLANASDAEGSPLTAVLVTGPAHAASFTLNSDGSFSYTPVANYYGSDSFIFRASDGSLFSQSATVSLTITAVNDLPMNTVPMAQTVTEDTALALGGISVADVEGLATVQLGVLNGTVTVTLSGGATITAGANGTGTLTLAGSQAAINTTLASLVYQGTLNYNGPDTLTVTTTDTNSATDSDTVALTVTAVNDLSVNTVPVAQTVNEDTALVIGGISVNDVDGNLATVQLGVANGTVTVTLSGGAVISAGANGTSTLTLAGSQAAINATLASLLYQGTLNYNGPDTLTVTSTDADSVTDVDTVAITVTPVNSVPALATNAGSTVIQGLSDLITSGELQITDVDNTPAQLTYTVTTAPVNGQLELTTAPGVEVTSFTQADINAGRLVFVHSGAPSTSDSFTFTVSDGAGGTIGATTFNLTVTPFAPPPPPTPPDPDPVPVPIPIPVPGPPGPIPGGVVPPVLPPPPVLVTVLGATEEPVRRAAMPSRTFARVEQPNIVSEEPVAFPLEPLANPVTKILAMGHKFAEHLTRLADDLERAMEEREQQAQLLGRVASFSGIALSAGFVAWLLHGGSLLTSFLVSMPAWRHFDPLPVLGSAGKDRRERKRKAHEEDKQESRQFRGLDRVLKSSPKPVKQQETGRVEKPKS